MTSSWRVLDLKAQLCCLLSVWPQARHLTSLCLGFITRLLWGLKEAKHVKCLEGARHGVSTTVVLAIISSPLVTLNPSNSGFCPIPLDSNHLKTPVTNQCQAPSLPFPISLTLSMTFHVKAPFFLSSQASPHSLILVFWYLSGHMCLVSSKVPLPVSLGIIQESSLGCYTFPMTILSYSGYKLPEPIPLFDSSHGSQAFQKTAGSLSTWMFRWSLKLTVSATEHILIPTKPIPPPESHISIPTCTVLLPYQPLNLNHFMFF